ncbi:hypothetical protein N2152v2_000343 [Parachlorella kessleri]
MGRITSLVTLAIALQVLCCKGQQSTHAAEPQIAAAEPPKVQLDGLQGSTITNLTIPAVLKQLATPDKQVVVAVVHLGGSQALDFLKNWALSLRAHGLLRHALILTTDLGSLQLAQAAGLPALLDGAFPAKDGPWKLHKEGIMVNRLYDVVKHWWGLRLIELGYSVLYSDVDVVFVSNPVPLLHGAPYDVQGLSDYFGPELPRLGEPLHRPCDFYKLVAEKFTPTGAQVRDIWSFRGDDAQTALQERLEAVARCPLAWTVTLACLPGALQVLTPCQSTGFWYLQPTNTSVAFMRALVDRLWALPWGWEQAAWQEVIMAYLIGMGSEQPLRFRILPVDQFANTGVFEERLKARLPVDPYIIHCGAVGGFENKMCALAKFNMWHPELWDGGSDRAAPQAAAAHPAAPLPCGHPDKQEKPDRKGQQAQQQQQRGWVVANWTFPFQPGDASVEDQAVAAAFLPRDPQGSWPLAGTVQKLVAQRAAAAAAVAAGAMAPSLDTWLYIAAGVLLVLIGAGVALARKRGKRRGFRAAGPGRKAASGHDNGAES